MAKKAAPLQTTYLSPADRLAKLSSKSKYYLKARGRKSNVSIPIREIFIPIKNFHPSPVGNEDDKHKRLSPPLPTAKSISRHKRRMSSLVVPPLPSSSRSKAGTTHTKSSSHDRKRSPTPPLKSPFQSLDPCLLDWKNQISPLETMPRRKRTDSNTLLLPMPSELQKEVSPADNISMDELIDWKTRSSPEEIPKGRKKRMESRSVLLPVPPLQPIDDNSAPIRKPLQEVSNTEESTTANAIEEPFIKTLSSLSPMDDVPDWRTELSPPVPVVNKRSDAKCLRLPAPSRLEKKDRGDLERSCHRTGLSPLNNVPDWRNELSPTIPVDHKRIDSGCLLLPQPTPEEPMAEIQAARWKEENAILSAQVRDLLEELEQQKAPSMNTKDCAIQKTALDALKLEEELAKALRRIDELERMQQEQVMLSPISGKSTPVKPSGTDVDLAEEYISPVRVNSRTILPAVSEEAKPDLDDLCFQRDAALIDKQKMQNQLAEMRKGYEDRITPFRDMFEAHRTVRRELVRIKEINARLTKENQEITESIGALQKQMMESLQVAMTQVQEGKKDKIAMEENERLLRLELAEAQRTIGDLRTRVSELGDFP